MRIEIQGKIVEVDDSFASMSPDEQQAVVDEIASSLAPKEISKFEEMTGVSETSPLLGGAVGAILGIPAGAVIEGATKGAAAPLPSVAGAPGTGGEKWAKNWAGMNKPGTTVPEAAAAYQRTKGQGPVTSKVTQRFGPGAKLDIGSFAAEQEALEARQRAQKSQALAQRTKQALGGAASSIPKWLGRGVAGASIGAQGVDTANRFGEGDYLGGAISGLGTLGSGIAMIPHPLTRTIGTAVGAGAPLLNELIDRARKQPPPQMAGAGEANAMPMAAGGIAKYAKGKAVVTGGLSLAEKFGFDPKKIASQYPDVLPPVQKTDPKSGKSYMAKQLSPEALAVQKARQAAQKEIDTGSYTPFFDITKRSYVNPANYSMPERTLTLTLPKKEATLAQHKAIAQSPGATARLEGAYEAAAGSPKAHGFYQMKQLEDEFVKELGPEAGMQAFKNRFALPMAATTGGQTPNANLMMTAMHNYFANKGLPIPSKGFDIPYPVGGNKLQSNIDKSQELFEKGALSALESPKRYNFASNFMGYADRPTIDEQMMGLFNPKGKGAPDWYGVNEEAVNLLAKKRGVDPVNYQEVAWAGAKGYEGQPMMEEINQMIYRTSRLTGEKPEEVLRGFIRGNKPMYGITGLGALGLQDTGGVNNPE
jgi:hypothetical protein